MALNKNDQERIRDYLLGQLSDDEQRQIEERLMTEDDLFEELEISKDEVIENYCAGVLTPKEQEWLEQHFLASSEGKLRRKFVLALNQVKAPAPKPSLIERFKALLRSQPWAVAAVATAALLIVVGAVVLRGTIFTSRPTPATTFLPLTLASSPSTRGTGSQPGAKVSLSPNIEELRITLELPEAPSPGSSYRAELDDRSKTRPVEVDGYDTKSVLVKVPAAQLQRGSYVLKLFTRDKDGIEQLTHTKFFFDVE